MVDEEWVTLAFCNWLERQGWTVGRDRAGVDVFATKDTCGPALYAEVKGHTTSPGLDVDTMFGQLLRRMYDQRGRYAVVVPDGLERFVQRVPPHIIERLGIEVYTVADDGSVQQVGRDAEH